MVCVDGCPDKTYGDDNTKTCEACRPECVTCYDGATCVECISGYIIDNGYCFVDCGSSEFYSQATSSCAACPAACATCLSAEVCTACANSFQLMPDGSCS